MNGDVCSSRRTRWIAADVVLELLLDATLAVSTTRDAARAGPFSTLARASTRRRHAAPGRCLAATRRGALRRARSPRRRRARRRASSAPP